MDIGRCLNDAILVYKKNLPQLVVAAFVFQLLSLLSLMILSGPLCGGWCLMTVNALRRKDHFVDLGDLFRGFRQFLPLVGLFWLTLVPIALGLVLLVIPGVLLMTIWVFAFFLMVDRGQGIFASLSGSREIVQRSGFLNYLLLVGIVLAIAMGPSSIPYLNVVLGWFVMPIAWLMEASAYVQETERELRRSASMPAREDSVAGTW